MSEEEQVEETTDRLEQEWFRQQLSDNQLIQSVRKLQNQNAELLVERDQLLKELREREQIELALRQRAGEWARSNCELEQFASLAAHDLQEPLHTIQVFLDLLRVKFGSSLTEQGQGYVDRVTKAAGRLQQLIEGLLVYSKVEKPKREGARLALKDLVEEVRADLKAQIDNLQATIHVGDLPTIYGDAVRIRQLFQNLLSNALKFHKPGVAPVIHVTGMNIQDRRHHGVEKPNWLCQIKVHDEGIGISAEHREEIFRMATRVHGSEDYSGSGIGLAVCQRIVDQCGGAISVSSTVGEGSTFSVTLPAGQD